ncbi:PLAT domain-containing protein 3 [Manihot esculenta]|uniref:PLAT domain-containing protein n=1 Tax=Manihot esculenta TaxID=3983 RepID=A0A2C9UXH2_MANES|nr:PLAT domain-containing protein 3 [Manihot esculenta]OAY35859.1 hypothetical protein MANES_12G136500v8 [Manihot esculenta]
MTMNTRLASFLLLLTVSTAVVADKHDCVYTIYVKTALLINAGTDSIISVTLYNAKGKYVEISNLESWGGLRGPDHDYFKRGNLDIFSGKGPCLHSPVCALNLTSDASGTNPDWYCEYVEVTTTDVHEICSKQMFTIDEWLSRKEEPKELTVIRNNCASKANDLKGCDEVKVKSAIM